MGGRLTLSKQGMPRFVTPDVADRNETSPRLR